MADRQPQMQPFPAHILEMVRQQRWQTIRSGMGRQGYYIPPRNGRGPQRPLPQPRTTTTDGLYDELPIVEPDDFGHIGPKPGYVVDFEFACKNGQFTTVQAIVSSQTRTPAFLHSGLVLALSAGNVEIADYLLAAGAALDRDTPERALSAPADLQIALFELLTKKGWTPNTPGYYGQVLLPRVVTNIPLLRWFLDHGANPNLGRQRYNQDRYGGPETDSGAALTAAAARADFEAVRILLDAGAKIDNGAPLHYVAGACPNGENPYYERVTPTKEFDTSKIPVMELLVERGADVNHAEVTRYRVPRYAIVHAVMAGAVERVRWLLEHGANPELKGGWGCAVTYARSLGSEEMRQVIEDGLAARRWISVSERESADSAPTGSS
ncbi:Hypothetical protein PENO1_097540 [Penicillium occitanis (nom. inval.)]|nr:Hypothetical protein PENO1_097540 [Penicillium occitanis (nom. inval.)]PCG91149.1 hypothetical protein PENOC_098830 [Penicillium occitanis (nom. inval.)]